MIVDLLLFQAHPILSVSDQFCIRPDLYQARSSVWFSFWQKALSLPSDQKTDSAFINWKKKKE